MHNVPNPPPSRSPHRRLVAAGTIRRGVRAMYPALCDACRAASLRVTVFADGTDSAPPCGICGQPYTPLQAVAS